MQPTQPLNLSLIIPVYNRPQEVDELLESLTKQTNPNFEVIIVEDGSTIPCKDQVDKYMHKLNVCYFAKPNSGPGLSRNYGAEQANGNYLVFLDSDCIIPEKYIETLFHRLTHDCADAFGGPDKADKNFTNIQKSINYAMTSFFTTGGIRGGNEKMDKFYPRSFNMGYSKEVFSKTGGFSTMRFGEDIDMSIRIYKNEFTCRLFTDAYVFHKRRTDYKKFFRQVFNSGIARIILEKRHPGSMKLVHTLPSLFVIGTLFLMILSIVWTVWAFAPLVLLCLIFIIDAAIKNASLTVGFLAIPACFIQLWGYGSGFLLAWWKIKIKSGHDFSAFENTFYQ